MIDGGWVRLQDRKSGRQDDRTREEWRRRIMKANYNEKLRNVLRQKETRDEREEKDPSSQQRHQQISFKPGKEIPNDGHCEDG